VVPVVSVKWLLVMVSPREAESPLPDSVCKGKPVGVLALDVVRGEPKAAVMASDDRRADGLQMSITLASTAAASGRSAGSLASICASKARNSAGVSPGNRDQSGSRVSMLVRSLLGLAAE